MDGVIEKSEEATAEWLTEVLRASGCLPRGHVKDVLLHEEVSYTSTIIRMTLTLSEPSPAEAPRQLLLKLSRPDAKQQVVRSEHRRREVAFHKTVVENMPNLPIARCHHAAYCEETGATSLLFDDLWETHASGKPLSPPEMPQAESAMDAFAAFHAAWWDHSSLSEISCLPGGRSNAEKVANIRSQFPRFADAAGSILTDHQRRIYEAALASLPALYLRVSKGKDLTLIHGDANFSNVLLPKNADESEAVIIDWQLYGISFAAEDLAHLIPLFWSREQRKDSEVSLLRRYHRGLLFHGVEAYDWDDCWQDYRRAVILRALFMPMWFWKAGASEEWWRGCLTRAADAVDDLHCRELMEAH